MTEVLLEEVFSDWDCVITKLNCGHVLPVSEIMRLLAEIVIIGALISLGWNKPCPGKGGHTTAVFAIDALTLSPGAADSKG